MFFFRFSQSIEDDCLDCQQNTSRCRITPPAQPFCNCTLCFQTDESQCCLANCMADPPIYFRQNQSLVKLHIKFLKMINLGKHFSLNWIIIGSMKKPAKAWDELQSISNA